MIKTENKYIPPILASLSVAILPHIVNLPIWTILWCFIMWTYIYFISKNKFKKPKKIFRLILTGFGLLCVAATAGGVFDGSDYIKLLAVMAGLKPLEIDNHRDRIVTLFLAYFLVITALFISESLLITIYMFFSVFITTATLMSINNPKSFMKHNFKVSSVIMLQALPLVIILFFLFPRLHGSLWGKVPTNFSTTGFSDTLSPGSVSNLLLDNSVAFRVTFKDKIPNSEKLYWRGIIFWEFKNNSWKKKLIPNKRKIPLIGAEPYEYTVILEPHNSKNLFALDLPATSSENINIKTDHTVSSRYKINKKFSYNVKSYALAKSYIYKNQLAQSLKLPDRIKNIKTRQLANSWIKKNYTKDEIIKEALKYFKNNKFTYTLKPPVLGKNSIDDFLFNKKKGYCEHYASAFTYLMRASNIPARIVGGYLGGEINPFGNYLIVRQSDAHVWAEVWFKDEGWIRVDPTVVVAPDRLYGSINDIFLKSNLTDLFNLKVFTTLSKYWKKIEFGWDAINNMWDIWFSSYSFEQQKNLLAKVGIKIGSLIGMTKTFLLLICIVFLFFVIYLILTLNINKNRKDEFLIIYNKFSKKLEKIGIYKKPSQGPLDFSNTVYQLRKDLKDSVEKITTCYINLRYGKDNQNKNLKKQFITLVAQFKPTD